MQILIDHSPSVVIKGDKTLIIKLGENNDIEFEVQLFLLLIDKLFFRNVDVEGQIYKTHFFHEFSIFKSSSKMKD